MIPFDDIQRAAVPYVVPLCRRWLGGKYKINGGWVTGPSPFRQDKTPSWGVSLQTGRAKDFATGETWDLIALYAAIHHTTMSDAARSVARAVGHPFADTSSASHQPHHENRGNN